MATTAQAICNFVRTETDQSYSDEVSDGVMLTWVDLSHRALYDIIIDKAIYNVSFVSASVATTSAVNLAGNIGFALPSDFYRMYRLDRVFGGGPSNNVNVPAVPISQRNAGWLASVPISTANGLLINPVGYIIEPPNVLLIPGAQASGNYTLGYYPTLPAMSSLGSPVLGIFDQTGWWEWIVYDVCERLLRRLDKPIDQFSVKKAEVRARIDHSAPNRDVTFGMRLDANRGKQRLGGWPFGNLR